MTWRLWLPILIMLLCPFPASAIDSDAYPFATKQTQWLSVLDRAQRYVSSKDYTPERSDKFLSYINELRPDAEMAKDIAGKAVAANQSLIDALGPAPAAGAARESPDIAAQRKRYTEAQARDRAHISEADLLLTRARVMETAISALRRFALIDQLQSRLTSPLSPNVMNRAADDLVAMVSTISQSPMVWYTALTPEQNSQFPPYRAIFLLLIGTLASFAVGRTVRRRFGRDPRVAPPTYRRRLIAAIAETIAQGLVPTALLGISFLWLDRTGSLAEGMFIDFMATLLGALLLLILVAVTTRAILSTDSPDWRLTSLTPEDARHLRRNIIVLAAVFASDILFERALRLADSGTELHAVTRLLFNTLEALAVITLAYGNRFGRQKDATPEPATETTPVPPAMLRRVVIAVVGGSIIATLAGYAELGRYLIHNLLASGSIAGGFVLARGLLREFLDLATTSRRVEQWLGVETKTLQTVHFWGRAMLNPLLMGVSIFVIAPLWGVPQDDLTRWTSRLLTGFPIGNVTISIVGILSAIATFFGAMLVIRMIQRRLLERVLPATRLEIGVQHSLAAGLGYLGIVIAAALAITVLGVDLTNLAMVAGALSVGIGFGLQNIVNNFVSGLILLIERPIRVGDWIHVGEREGIVKRVNVRATELETWAGAAVIIPNAEILSTNLLNWTLKDKLGRVDIKIGVAYGSDLALVQSTLLDCASRHPHILPIPHAQVLFQDFGDSSLVFELRCYTDNVLSRIRYASELRFDIDLQFRLAGIQIPFPQRVIHTTPASQPSSAI